jgi:epoxyqueuosine reductase QueG
VINSVLVKEKALRLGADLCNIASVDRFADAPEGFGPRDIFPDCQSVVVFLLRFPLSSIKCKSFAPYTFVRNMMVKKTDEISYNLCVELEEAGVTANAIPCDEPYEYWDDDKRQGKAILSLKHAAMLAGLGTLGKNTLLINDKFGNMCWIGAVLVSAKLDPDPMASYQGCIEDCGKCLDACPCNALDGDTIIQKACRETSFAWSPGGGPLYTCNTCRLICPSCTGILD